MTMTWGKRRAIVIIALIVLVVFLIWAASKPGVRIASNSVLVMDASGQIEEQRAPDFFSALNGTSPVLHDYLDSLDNARTDPRITGLVVRIAPLQTGWAKLEEIRNHLLAFRSSNKPSICYLGYDGIQNQEYYLASACQQVWLVPTTPVSIRGMMAEATFVRGTLDKLKIVPEYYHIAEFKTAGNMFTEKKFTPAHKEEVESLLRSVYEQYLGDTSKARGMSRDQFEAILNRGPLSSADALSGKIVDRVGYWDQIQDYFKKRGSGWNPVSLNSYRTTLGAPNFALDKIAIVYASGLIVSGDSGTTAAGGFILGGDSVAADIRRARMDSSIKAIVLRVDSGGGSVVGSEVIRREVELAHEVKPIVVSMSDVAASGGYWIASPADKIVADPNTITGSIGVIIGKLNVSGLFNLLGVSTDYVATSDNATLFSAQQNFTSEQREYIEKSLHETYDDFIKGVAAGRKMPVDAVDKIGKGRVWSGSQAKGLGLVDELGGVDRAIEVAKHLAHIPASNSVRLVRLPEEKTFFQQLFEREKEQMSQSESLQATLQHILGLMEPVQARLPYELHIK
ncbi:MAG TPA: signal peptide peptidase SppA [Candidatus Acidoferrales bacterium]|nr:signal peptide peptidase SppA [Candidatus Acidoferrales bacterium]